MRLCLPSSPSDKTDIPELLVPCFHFPGEKLPYLYHPSLLPPVPRCILPSGLCLLAVQTGLVSIQDLAALGSTNVSTRRYRRVVMMGCGGRLRHEGMRRNRPEGRELTLACSYQGSLRQPRDIKCMSWLHCRKLCVVP